MRLLLLIYPFISSFFFLSNFQTFNIFITFFSGTLRSRRLKLGTNVDSGQMYCVYRNQAAAALQEQPLFLHFFFSLQFSNIKIFRHTVRPRRLKLGTHVGSGWMYCVYQNKAAAAYLSIFSFSNIQTLKILVTLFSGTVRPRGLKCGAHMDNWWIYCVY